MTERKMRRARYVAEIDLGCQNGLDYGNFGIHNIMYYAMPIGNSMATPIQVVMVAELW